MFKLAVFALCLTATAVLAVPSPAYTTKYDNVNLDEIISNERLFSSYYNCLMDAGACSPDGAELKKVLPDALKTECGGCSDKQKEGAKKIFKFLLDNKQQEWANLEKKYDPTGIYKSKYDKALLA
ncbi:ejaculatory bulb-specific protein 3-like [Diaphorina citri]|uniref:Ejaculatory bulb-specific protein 3-like n=1 Tax=Diaphorina citri TaxID=121845 RepID=A0A1S3D047_DIACI|nr:ejaculatory bulb-specific protein 3-like [Diaphorina citri]